MRFAVEVAVAVAVVQLALSFYGFWLVWRLLLPLLPGPAAAAAERIAPHVGYFTDPFVMPLAGALLVPTRLVALLALIALAALSVALDRVHGTDRLDPSRSERRQKEQRRAEQRSILRS